MTEASSLDLPRLSPAPNVSRHRGRTSTTHDYLRRAADLAPRLAAGSNAASPFAHVTLGAVAEAAGVNRSTLYRHWPSQHEFWDDLLEFVLAGEPPADQLPSPRHQHVTADGALHDAAQDLLLSGREPLVETGLIGHPLDDRPRGVVAERRAERIAALTGELEYELVARGAECVGAVTPRDVAVALTIVGTGLPITGRLARRHHLRFDSGAYDAPPEAGRSLFGSLQVLLRTSLIRPATGPARPDAPPSDRAIPREVARASTGRRQDYLRIAADLAMDPDGAGADVGRALRYLTLDNLARALGLTRRTLGNKWPDQASFRLDLFSYLLRSQRDDVVQALRAARREAAAGPRCDPATLFLDLGDRIHDALLRRRHGLSFLAFAPHLDDVHVTNRARAEHDEALILVRHSLELLLQTIGVRTRPGVTPEQLAVAILVVCDGAKRLVRTDPQLVGTVSGCANGPRSVTAVTLATVLAGLTEPTDTRPQVARYLRLVS